MGFCLIQDGRLRRLSETILTNQSRVFVLFRMDAFPLIRGDFKKKCVHPIIRTFAVFEGIRTASVERVRPVYPVLICDIKEIPE